MLPTCNLLLAPCYLLFAAMKAMPHETFLARPEIPRIRLLIIIVSHNNDNINTDHSPKGFLVPGFGLFESLPASIM